ncbi:PAS domain-containing sensor histidine kinase [Salinirubellus salinus]|uniref:histidine kinase n=2 Tax=Salinirubellus salinus TaxID=1364945 RepID=A0A9E7R188_9EURY|nr:PAS domain-containing sensor histidine kinase [Salinirubellus salinus]UWM53855.1 PAS domain-containing sensor histidine kinase [Salinirubellus salinus]
MDIGIVAHDPETGAFVYANSVIEDLYGYSSDTLRTMSVGTLSAEGFTNSEAFERIRAASEGDSQEFTWQIQRASDEILWIRVRLVRTTQDDTPYVVGHVQNITEFKVRERRLKLLQRITRHNLRNQVQVIHGMTEELLTDIDSPQHRDDIELIGEATDNLLNLTETVDWLKSFTKEEKTVRRPVRLERLVSDVIDAYRREYPKVGWVVHYEDDCWVTTDDGLRFAFKEVVQNTVEHNPPDSLQVRVTVRETSQDGLAVLRVEDTGQPIPQIEVDALEGMYSSDQLNHGIGTGFWVMNHIVQTLGGRLSIEYDESFGNRVEFFLPQAEPPATT